MKILAATDFSEQAELAVAQAAALASEHDSELILAHVEPPASWVPSGAWLSDVAEGRTQELLDLARRETLAELEQRAARLRGKVGSVHYAATRGYPDDAIPECARDVGADLIVTGTHGHTGIKRSLIGSTAERVARHSTLPVLIVRGEVEAPAFHRVLVATDFTEHAERALAWAVRLAAPGAAVTLFHAWHPSFGGHDYFARSSDAFGLVGDELEGRALSMAREWMERHERPDLVMKFELAGGVAADLIEERARDRDYDLIAVGSHGYRGLRRLMVGSVAEHTLRHARCSVLIAHASPSASEH